MTRSRDFNDKSSVNDDVEMTNDSKSFLITVGMAVVSSVVTSIFYVGWTRQRRNSIRNKDDGLYVAKCTSASGNVCKDYESLIGNTPLLHLKHASSCLPNTKLYVKMECSNPGGTGKDRAAFYMLRHAEQNGQLPNPTSSYNDNEQQIYPNFGKENNSQTNISIASHKNQEEVEWTLCCQAMSKSRTGGIVVEGTSGSTGISLATLCAARGHACVIVMPDDQALEKQLLLQTLGAILHVVPTCAISNPNHYVNVARRIAKRINNNNNNHDNNTPTTTKQQQQQQQQQQHSKKYQACFINQFENLANFQAHYEWTGPELMQQLKSISSNTSNHLINTDTLKDKLLIFCMSSGTGGTLAGVGKYLSEQIHNIKQNDNTRTNSNLTLALVDPPGSALYNKIRYGVAYTSQQREQHFIRNQYNTLAEGIGLDRVTANFSHALPYVKQAVRITDQTAVDMAHYLLKYYGLFVGSSSAMNVAALLLLSKQQNQKIHSSNNHDKNELIGVTIICDTGQRHVTRFWNRDFITKTCNLQWPPDDQNAWKQRLRPFIDLSLNNF